MSEAPPKQAFYTDGGTHSSAAVRAALDRAGLTVVHFDRPAECLRGMNRHTCHLLVSDCRRPAVEGMRLLVGAQRLAPWIPVVFLVDPGDLSTAVRAMKAGAADCLERPPKMTPLLAAIECASAMPRKTSTSRDTPLSPAEHRVLTLVLEGLTNGQIARALNRSTRTVEAHRHHIMRKLAAQNVGDLVRICLRIGLLTTERAGCPANEKPGQITQSPQLTLSPDWTDGQ